MKHTNSSDARPEVSIDSLRQLLSKRDGKTVWRSLQELEKSPEFMEFLEREFPRQAAAVQHLSRREFLKFLLAPLALAGLSACVPQPLEKIVPYVKPPADIKPGKDIYYATAMEVDGFARGLLVKSTMGRPIKAEGNPAHPANLGATDLFGQAALLTMYDPDRAQVITNHGDIRTWDSFLSIFNEAMSSQSSSQGAGLRILSGTVTSPTLLSQMKALLEKFPQARWHQTAPVGRENIIAGTRMAFGRELNPVYRFDRASTILSIDADFTLREPAAVRYMHDFMAKRKVLNGEQAMNRLYCVETSLTHTGALADHRLPLHPVEVEAFARSLAQQLDSSGAISPSPVPKPWMTALLEDLKSSGANSLVIAGPQQPPEVHALAYAINAALGSLGNTLYFTDPVDAAPANGRSSLAELADDLNSGKVDLLVVLDQNPVYDAPADLDFASAYQKAGLSVCLGLYEDETAAQSDWHLPAAHFLEAWGDTRAYDGTVSIIQPLIEPLYAGKTPYELLALMLDQTVEASYDVVNAFWQTQAAPGGLLEQAMAQLPPILTLQETTVPTNTAAAATPAPEAQATPTPGFQLAWQMSLKQGIVAGTALPPLDVSLSLDLESSNQPSIDPNQPVLVFEPDPSIWDGRWANNGWLQELPKRLTKLTWDNAAVVSPALASQLQLNDEDVIRIQLQDRSVLAPVYILPGQPEKSITLHLGYGRQKGGQVLVDHGFSAYQLRTTSAMWFAYGASIQKTGKSYSLATTQHHQTMDGRDLARSADLGAYLQNPQLFQTEDQTPPSLYPEFEYNQNKWGMSINLNACTGCNACVLACQAENNIPVVGKDQVIAGHEMHWLRIDRYFEGVNLDQPNVLFQPVTCMQCEDAPCEPVCPVEATVHDEEGLNEMIYNRCVGTRYCSNNCPYKVRRFNFLQFSDLDTESLKLLHNPDVTVRSRGVMEKCTYCIQRITHARIQAEEEGRPIRDGEIKTACQQACPTNAIVFGDLNQNDSQVVQMKQDPRNYAMLAELGTRPRTTYLAKLRNPNPRLQSGES